MLECWTSKQNMNGNSLHHQRYFVLSFLYVFNVAFLLRCLRREAGVVYQFINRVLVLGGMLMLAAASLALTPIVATYAALYPVFFLQGVSLGLVDPGKP
jgi:hypothetical protein